MRSHPVLGDWHEGAICFLGDQIGEANRGELRSARLSLNFEWGSKNQNVHQGTSNGYSAGVNCHPVIEPGRRPAWT